MFQSTGEESAIAQQNKRLSQEQPNQSWQHWSIDGFRQSWTKEWPLQYDINVFKPIGASLTEFEIVSNFLKEIMRHDIFQSFLVTDEGIEM